MNIISRIINITNKLRARNAPLYISKVSILVFILTAVIFLSLGFALNILMFQAVAVILFIESICNFLQYRALKLSLRKPDYVFNYGYGKYESLSIFLSTIFNSVYLLYLFIISFSYSTHIKIVDFEGLLIGILILVILLIFIRLSVVQKKQSQTYQIESLKSLRRRLKDLTIFIFSILVAFIIHFILLKLTNILYVLIFDYTYSILLIIINLKTPLSRVRNALDQLMDKNLPEYIQYDLIGIIAENLHRMCKFNTMHTRQSGNDLFIELDIILPWDYSIEQKYDLEKDIKSAILLKYPNSIIRLYVLPCDKECIDDNGCSNCPIKKKKSAKHEQK